jgi:hypothetical protein
MKKVRKYGVAGAAGISAVAAVSLFAGGATPAIADESFARGIPFAANPRDGVRDNVLAANLRERAAAWGQLPLQNPDTGLGNTYYGYNTSNGGPLAQNPKEAFKTEPDKNVYLVLNGHHYLYQGHEGGPAGYVTRVDLDQANPAQRVSLVADRDPSGAKVPTFDGITWNPFTHQLLLTAEASAPTGGVFGIGLDADGNATTPITRLTAVGSGGYEGVQNDADGNVWLVEDIGGTAAGTGNQGKVPNSYVYRFRPTDRTDLTKGGKLQALQVLRADGTPATAAQLQTDGRDPILTALHTYGTSFRTRWATVADPSNATAGAKAAGATPFKRPENGVFRPGTQFGEFYFTETGDTNASSDLPGAFGAVFRLRQSGPSADSGTLSPVTVGTVAHTGFDNIAFATTNQLLVVEDAGDSLHRQRDALDSGYVIDLRNGGKSGNPVRWLAEGRDASATYDALFSPGYNDGDNEITGIHVSDGDAGVGGILGAKLPKPFKAGWRVFWTQQHGDNVTWEVLGDPAQHHDNEYSAY